MAIATNKPTQNHGAEPFRWPGRNWWLALLAILVLAGALRYPGYAFGLPFVGNSDEIYFALAGRMNIDFGTAKSMNFHHYPPVIINIYYLVMRLFQDLQLPPASVIWIVRLIAITTSLGIISTTALFGYHLGGRLAGLLGAALWSITPLFVHNSRFGTAEIFVAFFITISLYLTLVAMRYCRGSWSTFATYALMLAILSKYHTVFLAPVVLFAPLWGGVPRRRILENCARFALFGAYLLFLTPLLDAYLVTDTTNPNQDWVSAGHIQVRSLPNPLTLLANVLANIGDVLNVRWIDWQYLVPGWLGLLLIARDRSWRGERSRALAVLLTALLLWVVGISFFGATTHAERFLFAWLSLLVMLSAWGYALLLRALWRALQRYDRQRQRWGISLAFLTLFTFFLPYLSASIEDLRHSLRLDPRNLLTAYMDTSLPSGRYSNNNRDTNLFNREWGGYAGNTAFELASWDNFQDHSIQHWRDIDLDYAILHHYEYEELRQSDPGGHLRETTLLKAWEPRPDYRHPAMVVLRLQPIQHSASGQLGPIHLVGYDLDNPSPAAEQTLRLHLYWQAQTATDADYQVFNHLLDDSGHIVAQSDGQPLSDTLLRRGTSAWDDPREILYSREFAFPLPADLDPGQYTLITGFYHRQDGQRLRGPSGEDSLQVAQIQID